MQEEVQVEDAGPIGAGETQPCCRCIAYVGSRGGRGCWGRGTALSRFVGRERELAMLHERLRHAIHGQGQVLGLAGEPGIGKSRLLHEFRQRLGDQPVTYAEGHCLAYGNATPYLPLVDLLRQLWGTAETESPEAIPTKVHAHLHALGLHPPTRHRICYLSWAWRPIPSSWPGSVRRRSGHGRLPACSRSALPAVGSSRSSWRWRTCTGAIPPRRSG